MNTTLSTLLRLVSDRSRDESPAGTLFDAWIDRWVAQAEARWRQAGDAWHGRHY